MHNDVDGGSILISIALGEVEVEIAEIIVIVQNSLELLGIDDFAVIVEENNLRKDLEHGLENRVVVLRDVGVFAGLGTEKKLEGVLFLLTFVRDRLIIDGLSVSACVVCHVLGCWRRCRGFRHGRHGRRCLRT